MATGGPGSCGLRRGSQLASEAPSPLHTGELFCSTVWAEGGGSDRPAGPHPMSSGRHVGRLVTQAQSSPKPTLCRKPFPGAYWGRQKPWVRGKVQVNWGPWVLRPLNVWGEGFPWPIPLNPCNTDSSMLGVLCCKAGKVSSYLREVQEAGT